MATLVEERDRLEEGENGGDVGEVAEESETNPAEFVVATSDRHFCTDPCFRQTSSLRLKTLRPARSPLLATQSLSPLDTKGQDDG